MSDLSQSARLLVFPRRTVTLTALGHSALDRATTIQHLRGRRGARLLRVEWWAGSCWAHNTWAEDHTGEALAIGWLQRIESVDGAA